MGPPPHQPPPLPVDPLLEIVARCDDAKSVIRCAAVSRPLRSAILDPGFRRRLGLRAAANGGFDPDLLMGVSFSLRPCSTVGDHSQQARHLRFDTDLLRSFELVSSRDGLLVLRRNQEGPAGIRPANGVELLVCNTITGHVSSLPKPGGSSIICRPAFLSTGRSFELLVMYYRGNGIHPVTQIFSSEKAEWGAARRIHLPQGVHPAVEATTTAPAVIGSNVHWLCSNIPNPFSLRVSDLFILALHADAEQATVISLPQDLPTSMMSGCNTSSSYAHSMILAATEGGKSLSLIVAEKLVIAVWTLLPDEGTAISSWSRQVVIRRGEIGRQLTSVMDAYQNIRFEVFGERSGTVVFWVRMGGLVQLNLGTKKAVVLWKGRDYNYLEARSFLSEVDLVSLLRGMKHFSII